MGNGRVGRPRKERNEAAIVPKPTAMIYMNRTELTALQDKILDFFIQLHVQGRSKTAKSISKDGRNMCATSIAEIATGIKYKSRNMAELARQLLILMDTKAEYDIFEVEENKNRMRSGIGAFTFFDSLEIFNDGTVHYILGESFRYWIDSLLHGEKIRYVYIDFSVNRMFSSKYTAPLFQLSASYTNGIPIPRLKLDKTLMKFFGAPASYLENIARVKMRVFGPAIRELEDKTGIKISAEIVTNANKGKTEKYVEFTRIKESDDEIGIELFRFVAEQKKAKDIYAYAAKLLKDYRANDLPKGYVEEWLKEYKRHLIEIEEKKELDKWTAELLEEFRRRNGSDDVYIVDASGRAWYFSAFMAYANFESKKKLFENMRKDPKKFFEQIAVSYNDIQKIRMQMEAADVR